MLAWYMFVGSETPSYTEITVPKGQRVHLTLPDGSEAWLSSLSTLKWPSVFSSDARTVELDGEGFFTVTKDASRPFTVQTQKYDVRVLGTEFNVYAYSNSEKFETDLLSGKVRVSSTGFPEESVNLLPDEKVSLVDGKLVSLPLILEERNIVNKEFMTLKNYRWAKCWKDWSNGMIFILL